MSIQEAKAYIDTLKNLKLKISVNKGRKRVVRYTGRLDKVYPSVFTLVITGDKNVNMLSCSYSDVICGDIILKEDVDKKPSEGDAVKTEALIG